MNHKQALELTTDACVIMYAIVALNMTILCCSADETLMKPGTRTPPPPFLGRAKILGHLSDAGATGGDGPAAQASGNLPRARANPQVYTVTSCPLMHAAVSVAICSRIRNRPARAHRHILLQVASVHASDHATAILSYLWHKLRGRQSHVATLVPIRYCLQLGGLRPACRPRNACLEFFHTSNRS